MPYASINDLPDAVRENLPDEAAEILLAAYNSAEQAGRDEGEGAAIAWGAVHAAGWEKENDRWVKKEAEAEDLKLFYGSAKEILPVWMMQMIKKAAQLVGVNKEKPPDNEKDKNDRSEKTVDIEKTEVRKNLVRGILKVDDEKQIVTGIVLEPEVEDAQGDIISAEEIEKAAHGFLAKSRIVGKSHAKIAKAEVVESYIAPDDFNLGSETVRKGTWLLSVKVHDRNLWEEVKTGEITGFSIGAIGIRQTVA